MMNVPFEACFSVSRRPMCCTSGSSSFARGSVTLTWSPIPWTGSESPTIAASSPAHPPPPPPDRRPPHDARLDPGPPPPGPNHAPPLDGPQRIEGRDEKGVRVALARAVGRPGEVAGKIGREPPQRAALEHVRLEPGL